MSFELMVVLIVGFAIIGLLAIGYYELIIKYNRAKADVRKVGE